MYKLSYLLLFCGIVQFSCTTSTTTEQETRKEPKPFFDVKSYFEDQISVLEKKSPKVRKMVTIDQKTEEQELDSLNFAEELKAFIGTDINRLAWFDKYSKDSTIQNNQLLGLEYAALDEDLKVRKLSIQFSAQQEVETIQIATYSSSFVAKSKQDLIYEPLKGYSISTQQGLSVGQTQDIKVEVLFK